MLYLFTGTDREKVRTELDKAITREGKDVEVVRVSDANAVADLQAALQGGGMFGGKRIVVLQDVFANEEMRVIVEKEIKHISKSNETFFILEQKPDSATRKMIEKYAEKSERFDAKKEKGDGGEIFALANALRRADKKALWVGLMRELSRDNAPEAIHGVLFWGAKQMMLNARGAEQSRAARLLATLAELPHESRRKGVELEYALERFALDCA